MRTASIGSVVHESPSLVNGLSGGPNFSHDFSSQAEVAGKCSEPDGEIAASNGRVEERFRKVKGEIGANNNAIVKLEPKVESDTFDDAKPSTASQPSGQKVELESSNSTTNGLASPLKAEAHSSQETKRERQSAEVRLEAKGKRKKNAADKASTEPAVQPAKQKTKRKNSQADAKPIVETDKKKKPKAKASDVKQAATPAGAAAGKKRKRDSTSDAEAQPTKKTKVTKVKAETKVAKKQETAAKGRKVKKEETEVEVWRWWEEEKKDVSIKWKFLEHKGPLFAPAYDPVPEGVNFYYDGLSRKPMKLALDTEEVASFYAKMLDHEYTTKEVFNKNFFHDWRKVMTPDEREKITDLTKCNFREMCDYYLKKSEERKAMSKEEKQRLKEEQEKIRLEYGVAVVDGHKEKIGNFKIEPPGLFRGRGTHPKMGRLKRRIQPEDVIINCSKDSKVPDPPPGHKWKEVRYDNTVTWLASWTENIMGSNKYVMLNPSSKIKGEKDWEKYETARKLKGLVDGIRTNYRSDWKSKETKIRQRSVALYFIDKLALRAGHEKEDNETADTVGCCSLRCEHIKLHDELDGQENVVEFDFLGKDSIRYYNRVPVERRVFKNLKIFMEHKDPEDDLFDRLSTASLNKHLQSLMDGLTAKVFRTYNASITLQQQLEQLTKADMNPAEKLLAYNRANRQVAILCNHQRTVSKAHDQQMENIQKKIDEKEKLVKEAKAALKKAKADHKAAGTAKTKKVLDQKQKALLRVEDQLLKLRVRATDKEENKEIALSTSKLNYLDPRITVAWCKKYEVPIDKIYNKTQREKFRWAIDMAGPDFVF
ncbi:DNA topoisomerase 1 [Trichuris trichiura]|uniref:DNA topoisomerase I n=1 Tax=Trichuris trichiura TaxID=36087 RepID=A0A077Z1Y2_TRITR|nr:DNA topoisomerase 1 [Trichuris trichiura]